MVKRGLYFCRTGEVFTSVGQERFVFLSDKRGLYFLYDGYNGSLSCSFIKQQSRFQPLSGKSLVCTSVTQESGWSLVDVRLIACQARRNRQESGL